MEVVQKLFNTALDQVIEFAEIPPPLLSAWSRQAWGDVALAGASFVPHLVLVRSSSSFISYSL